MPLLDRNGSREDRWTRSEGAAIGNIPAALVPWEVLVEALDRQEPEQVVGVILPNSVPFSALAPFLPRLALVAITFPAYADGRGFSLARQIRRAGFAGEIRANGPLIADQFAYALSCGFDTIELPEDGHASAEDQKEGDRQQDVDGVLRLGSHGKARRNVHNHADKKRHAIPGQGTHKRQIHI